ncbi:hypothetical protein BC828DRAFT_393421 [Blastocladiella britannica]|nr:hypothetical protein BC828DRAFT_393421 [Blastocladiella britannica]
MLPTSRRLALSTASRATAAAAVAVHRPTSVAVLRQMTVRGLAYPPDMFTDAPGSAHDAIPRKVPGGMVLPRSRMGANQAVGPKVVSAEEAVAAIPSGSRIYVHGAACMPHVLLDALAARAAADPSLKDIEFTHLHLEATNPCMQYPDQFFTNNLFVGAGERKNVAHGRSSYVPVFLSDMGRLMRDNILRPDVALLNVSPPDQHGFVTLGLEVATALPAAETSRLLIAQINPHMPATRGSTFIPLSAFDYVVPTPHATLPSVPLGETSDIERQIGEHIAAMIPDGATLQMGIGAVPNAVLAALKDHKHLGVHTEMFSDGLIPLLKSGAVDNSQKRYQRGRVVTSFLVGSQELYDFVDDNPQVLLQEAAVTNDPVLIGMNPKVTAINSAVAVDLTGQVAADSVGTYQVSGVGGQIDFERGAAISRGGIPIIALPSTNLKDGSTKIVPHLLPGSGVVTTRYHVHNVVTEYGVARLFGHNYHERARRLIAIAHPDHRAELEREAFERYGLKAWRV